MNKKKENYRGVLQEEKLTDVHSSQLNGTLIDEDQKPEKEKSAVWRRLTITFTIIATSITLTFSWQKKTKIKETNAVQTEQIQNNPSVVNALALDTIKK